MPLNEEYIFENISLVEVKINNGTNNVVNMKIHQNILVNIFMSTIFIFPKVLDIIEVIQVIDTTSIANTITQKLVKFLTIKGEDISKKFSQIQKKIKHYKNSNI